MQMLFCIFNPYTVVKIQFPLSCTSELPLSAMNLYLLFGNVSGLLVASLYLGVRYLPIWVLFEKKSGMLFRWLLLGFDINTG